MEKANRVLRELKVGFYDPTSDELENFLGEYDDQDILFLRGKNGSLNYMASKGDKLYVLLDEKISSEESGRKVLEAYNVFLWREELKREGVSGDRLNDVVLSARKEVEELCSEEDSWDGLLDYFNSIVSGTFSQYFGEKLRRH